MPINDWLITTLWPVGDFILTRDSIDSSRRARWLNVRFVHYPLPAVHDLQRRLQALHEPKIRP